MGGVWFVIEIVYVDSLRFVRVLFSVVCDYLIGLLGGFVFVLFILLVWVYVLSCSYFVQVFVW